MSKVLTIENLHVAISDNGATVTHDRLPDVGMTQTSRIGAAALAG